MGSRQGKRRDGNRITIPRGIGLPKKLKPWV